MNFETLSKKMKKFGQETVTEMQKMSEVRQLTGKINDEKRFLNRLFLEMGQKLYDQYKNTEQPLEGFEEDFRKIAERYSVMDLLQDQIRTVKGVTLCPCCNMEVSVEEKYCSNCGSKMPEVVQIEETAEDSDAIEVESEVVGEAEEVVEVSEEAAEKAEDSEEAEIENVEEAVEVSEETEPENEEEAAEVSEEAETEKAEEAVEVSEETEVENAEKAAEDSEEAEAEKAEEAAEEVSEADRTSEK